MPRPLSKSRKQLHGTLRKDRQRRPPTTAKAPTWPPVPAKTPAAVAAVWRELAPQFWEVGVLTSADLPAFRQLVEAVVMYRAAAAECLAKGFTSEGSEGQLRKSPTAALASEWWAHVRRAYADFGMNPAARRGVDAQPPNTKPDLLQELLDRREAPDAEDLDFEVELAESEKKRIEREQKEREEEARASAVAAELDDDGDPLGQRIRARARKARRPS